MIFVFITFITAFLIEGLGTLVSVIGLSALFGANPIIIALAVSLDLGKLVVVSLLYTYWKKLQLLMKSYALIAAVITMVITSAGAAGYLSARFQEAVIGVQTGSLKVDLLKQEQLKLEARKKQIDDQIANLPSNFSRGRVSLMNQFKDEQERVTKRLVEIDQELPTLQVQQINVEAKAGPILYVAKAFDVPVEQAVKYVILLIIFVFDPLAVFLIIAGNFLLHQHRLHKEQRVSDADLFDDTDQDKAENFTSPKQGHSAQMPNDDNYLPEPTSIPPMPPVKSAAPIFEVMQPTPKSDTSESSESPAREQITLASLLPEKTKSEANKTEIGLGTKAFTT